jgi:hypothetical protein
VGKGADSPKLSGAEKDLIKTQKQLLEEAAGVVREQLGVYDLLSPILYEQAGLKPTMDAQGNITGFEKLGDPLGDKYKQIEGMFADRTLSALKGELPVDPGLMRDLGEQEQQLRESMFKQLGPGWETSTPGIEALGDFMERKNILIEQARRGDLSMASQLGMGVGGFSSGRTGDFLGRTGAVMGQPTSMASLFTGISGGYNSPLATYGAARQAASQQTAGLWGGVGSLLGAGISAGGMIGAAALCWVARAVFGEENPRWLLFREWLLNKAPAELIILYFKVGEQFADSIKDNPVMLRYMRRWMNKALEG